MNPWTLSVTGSDYYPVLTLPVTTGEGAGLPNATISGRSVADWWWPFPQEYKLTVAPSSTYPDFSLTAKGYGLTTVTATCGTDSIEFEAYWPEMVDRAYCAMAPYSLEFEEDGSTYYRAIEATIRLGLAYWETWRGMTLPRWDWPGAASRNQRLGFAPAQPELDASGILGWEPQPALTIMPDEGFAWWSYQGARLATDEWWYGRMAVKVDPSGVFYDANPFGYDSMEDYDGWQYLEAGRNCIPRLCRSGSALVSVGWTDGWLHDGFTGERIVEASMLAAWDVAAFEDGSYAVWVFEPGSLTLYRWTPHSGTITESVYSVPQMIRRLRAARSGTEHIAFYVSGDGLCSTKGGLLLEANRSTRFGLYELPQGDFLIAAKWHDHVQEWTTGEWHDGVEGALAALTVTPCYALLRTDGGSVQTVDSFSDASSSFLWPSSARYHGL